MPLINKNNQIVEDNWQPVTSADEINNDRILVPFALWLEASEALLSKAGNVGITIDGGQDLSELAPHLDRLKLVAIEFPSFADGRGFSTARLLRERYDYKGEIRAVGEVTWDRLAFMRRCGFDSYNVPDERYDPDMIRAFDEISVRYQGAADDSRPIYRQ